MTRMSSIGAGLVVLLASAAAFALSPAQCSYFAVGGKTAICHATGSSSNPFVPMEVAVVGCSRGHSTHHTDYVAVGDPSCQGGGCLATDAPCDATLPCCTGTCTGGVCVAACSPIGGPCSTHDDCCSGSCCSPVCTPSGGCGGGGVGE